MVLVPMPSMRGAQRDQKIREILHMRLGRDVAQMAGTVRRYRGHQRVFRGRHAWLVEETSAPLRRGQRIPAGRGDHRGAEFVRMPEDAYRDAAGR